MERRRTRERALGRAARAAARLACAAWALGATAAGAAEPACADAAPELASGGTTTEYWDLVARLEPGFLLFQRFLVTNVGPGERTAGAVGVVVRPDGSVDHFDNGKREGAWSLMDGLRLEVGKSALDLRAPEIRLAVTKKSARLDLGVPCDADARAQPPAAWGPPGYRVRVLAVSAPIAGSLWLRGMEAPVLVSGRAAVTHTFSEDEPAELQRRLEFHALSADRSWSLLSLLPPEAADDPAERSWIVFTRGDETVHAAQPDEITRKGSAPGWTRDAYPVPAGLRIRSGERVTCVDLGPVLHARNPLVVLPQPFRWWLQLRSDPLRVWARGVFAVTIRPGSRQGGGEPDAVGCGVESEPGPPLVGAEWRGDGLAALSFIHPADPPMRAKRPTEPDTRSSARASAGRRP